MFFTSISSKKAGMTVHTMLVLALHSSTAIDCKKFGLACDELLDVTIDFQPKHCD
jgi:hypothetical protein